MLDIVASYRRMQFQVNLFQNQENSKKPHFGPDLGPLGPNLDRQLFILFYFIFSFFFFKNLASSATSYYGQPSS